jgi:hypothetical protein
MVRRLFLFWRFNGRVSKQGANPANSVMGGGGWGVNTCRLVRRVKLEKKLAFLDLGL